jgi:hypothetical protein
VASWPKNVQGLATLKKNGFLGLSDNELCPGAEFLARKLPGKNAVRPIIFDKIDCGHGFISGAIEKKSIIFNI